MTLRSTTSLGWTSPAICPSSCQTSGDQEHSHGPDWRNVAAQVADASGNRSEEIDCQEEPEEVPCCRHKSSANPPPAITDNPQLSLQAFRHSLAIWTQSLKGASESHHPEQHRRPEEGNLRRCTFSQTFFDVTGGLTTEDSAPFLQGEAPQNRRAGPRGTY